jgi:hypothetical protein
MSNTLSFVNLLSKTTMPKAATVPDKTRRRWLADNPGRLAQIARDHKVTSTTVSLVFRGRGRSARIEKALAEAGAPGFKQTTAA